MEKVRVRRYRLAQPTGELDLEEANEWTWAFTEEDREAILEVTTALPGYRETSLEDSLFEPAEAATFIEKVEMACVEALELAGQPKKVDARGARERILKRCRKALEELTKVALGEGDYIYLTKLDPIRGEEEDPNDDLSDQAFFAAREAIEPLEKFAQTIEEIHESEVKLPHRAPADSDQFIRRLASIYREHIGEPTAYKSFKERGPSSGGFSSLVEVVLRVMGLPHEDPSRKIRAALK